MDDKKIDQNLAFVTDQISKLENKLNKEIESLNSSAKLLFSNSIKNNNQRYNNTQEPIDLEKYIEKKNQFSDKLFIEKMKEKIKDQPRSNGSKYFPKYNISIGIVSDEFLFKSYENTANLIYLTPLNYKEYAQELDLILIVSAWKGLNGEWIGLGNPKKKEIRDKMANLISFFQQNEVKVAFYSKEDPTNYTFFIEIAKKCDIIFTTAVEKIPDYKKDCNTDQVYLLEFGFNPLYNNPIGRKSKTQDEFVIFAGSWYAKYPHRQIDTRRIFDDVIASEETLKIIDRNYHRNHKNYLFPLEYVSYLSPAIDHETLQLLSKKNTWMINLNSIQDSSTMFASRIYELQAMGNLVLSNYSLGVNNLFPTVFMGITNNELKNVLSKYNNKELYEIQMFGVRKVMRSHTTFHRISKLLNKSGIGFNLPIVENGKKIAVIFDSNNDIDILKQNFNRQTYQNKLLVPLEEINSISEDEFDFITIFSDEYFYGEFYLEDMINSFKYTDVPFVTKECFYKNGKKVGSNENEFVDQYSDIYRTVFSLDEVNIKTWQQLRNDKKIELRNGYSNDSLELELEIEEGIYSNRDYKFSVIIPAYNNGDHLYGKCFLSLRRSSMFKDMEIIIIDDGSTDNYTTKIIGRLERNYPNVKIFMYEDGGSGSASRPRNKGVQLASTPYVTFLDPDNEAINDGYAKLYTKITQLKVDAVIGNIVKADQSCREVNYFKGVLDNFPKKTVFYQTEVDELLLETSFKSQSIQAMMIKRSLLIKQDLRMVEGVVGEDTLYFWEVLYHSRNFAIIDEMIHVYYAGVEGSSVNNITVSTFEKYKRLEKQKLFFLKKHNLLKGYMALRFPYYFRNWYVKKLEMVNISNQAKARELLMEIFRMYEPFIDGQSKEEIKNLLEDNLYV